MGLAKAEQRVRSRNRSTLKAVIRRGTEAWMFGYRERSMFAGGSLRYAQVQRHYRSMPAGNAMRLGLPAGRDPSHGE